MSSESDDEEGARRTALGALFSPSSVAIVGASDDPSKWGNWLARGALLGERRRSVYLVNRRAAEVFGRRAYRSLGELPEPVELVVVAVPSSSFDEAIDEALESGVKAIVGITAGFAETGEEGRAREAKVVAKVRAAGAVLLGPNCLGVMDSASDLYLVSNDLPAGPIGLISQSGNLALELGVKASVASLGFSRFVSLGNQADLEIADLLELFLQDGRTEVVALYCEDFKDGRRFLEAAGRAHDKGVPVILLAPGRGEASVRAARSHTGALVSGERSIDAACEAAGIERVATPKQLVDAAQALLCRRLPRGRRVGVVGDGGGHAAVAADAVEACSLEVPMFSSGLSAAISAALNTTGGTSNPVDFAGAGEQDLESFERVVALLFASPEVDSVLLTGYYGGYFVYDPEMAETERSVARRLVSLAEGAEKPFVVHAMHFGDASVTTGDPAATPLSILRGGGIPVYADVEDAAAALRLLARRAQRRNAGVPGPVVESPGPAEGGYFAARRLLSSYGVSFLPAREVRDGEDALAAAEEVGYPVAVKAVALEHKSDAAGVVLSIEGPPALEATVRELRSRLGPGPLSIEAMWDETASVELLVGAVRDPRFGPIALVGMGGIYAEFIDDVVARLAPVTSDEAEEMIFSLKGVALLKGVRGRPPLAIGEACEALEALSRAAAEHAAIAAVEVNPLVVGRSRVVALDARLVLAEALPSRLAMVVAQ